MREIALDTDPAQGFVQHETEYLSCLPLKPVKGSLILERWQNCAKIGLKSSKWAGRIESIKVAQGAVLKGKTGKPLTDQALVKMPLKALTLNGSSLRLGAV